MVFTYSIKKERQKHLHFSQVAHIKQSYNFFLRSDFAASQQAKGHSVKFETYDDLKGYKIAATRGIAYTPEFWRNVHEGNLDTFMVVNNELTMKMLLKGRVDLIPHNLIPGLWLAKNNGYSDQLTVLPKAIKEKSYFNAFVKDSSYPGIKDHSLIERYDEVISEMLKNGEINQILKQYGIK